MPLSTIFQLYRGSQFYLVEEELFIQAGFSSVAVKYFFFFF